jgi:thiamine kinase
MSSVENALVLIPGFSGAAVELQLSDGPTNASYLLRLAGEQYVLRLDKPGARALGLNRRNEKQILAAIAKAGLAPAPLCFDLREGVLLRHYLQGRSWTREDLESQGQLHRLSRLLRELHGVSPVGDAFDPVGAARRYVRQMENTKSTVILRRLEKLATEITESPQAPVLCHNDLVCQNILEGETLGLIDWEYAAIGDRYFDLAVVLQHHKLDAKLCRVFVEEYLGRSAKASELRQLSLQREFYQCLLDLWNQRVESFR